MTTPVRFGILGAANIARKNWHAIRNSGNATLTAVASRDRARAQAFIDLCQADVPFATAPRALGSYEELLASPEVDAVYVPLPTGVRREWVERAAAAGKHVLCEKPCGGTAGDVAAMVAACERHGVQFMDGVMFMHSRRLPAMRQVLDDGTSVGEVRRVSSVFSFLGGEEFLAQNIRVSNQLEPLGCLGDLGWYNIRFTLWAMGYVTPQRVRGQMLRATPDGVPLEFSAEMWFPSGATASFFCAFTSANQQTASISGTLGHLNLMDFVLPFHGCESRFAVTRSHFEQSACHFRMEERTTPHRVQEYSSNHPDSQEANMVRTFAALARSGTPDPTWGRIALQTQRVLDACLQSARSGADVELA